MKKPKGSSVLKNRGKKQYNLVDSLTYDTRSPKVDVSAMSCEELSAFIYDYEHTNTLLPRSKEEIAAYEAAKTRYQDSCTLMPNDVAVGDIMMMSCQQLSEYIKWYEENTLWIKNANEAVRYQYAKERYSLECPYSIPKDSVDGSGGKDPIVDIPVNKGIPETMSSGGSGGSGSGAASGNKKSWWWILVVAGLLAVGYMVTNKKTPAANG